MKVLRCSMCKNTIDISYDSETLKCPTCGKVYKNPLYKQNAVAPQNDEKPENQAPQEKTEQKPAPASNNEQSEIELLKARLAEMEKKQAANEQKIQTSQPKSTGKAVAYLKENWKWMLVACLVLTTAITLLVCFVGIRGVYYNVDNPNEFYSFSPTKYEGHSVLEFSGDEIVETGKWKVRGNQMIFSMGSELFGEISVSSYFSKIDNKHFYLGEDKDNCSEFKRVSLKQYKSLRNKKIKVTFDVNGGSGNNTTITVNTGYKTDAEIEIPTKNGYSFRGWYTDPWGYTNEKSLRFDKNNRIWESCTYYANWYNPTIYSITIKDKGASFTAHEGDLLLPIISGNGKFEGKCYLDGILIDENTRMPAKNVTITVELTKTQPIKFTLDAKGGQLSGANEISVNYLESIDKINAFPIPTHPDGLIFAGWACTNNSLEDVLITNLNGQTLPNLWQNIKDNITLNAIYCDLSDYKYSIENGQITITNYHGTSNSVSIPLGVTNIEHNAFYGCSGLTSVTIPDSVTDIGAGAFSGCSNLENITLPFVGGSKSATSASSSTLFGYIFGTSSYTGGTKTEQYYSDSSYKTYYIPSSLRSVTITGGNILYGAFYKCSGLTSVTIGNGVTNIGDYAFIGCSDLTSVTIGNGVTSIGYCAFNGCSSLTSVTIPNSVTSIDHYAFFGCNGLTSVTISSSVTSIGNHAFNGCSNLTNITVSFGNSKYHSAGNCIIETATKTLFAGCNSSVIPNDGSVTSIAYHAFEGCSGLTSITIPNSVTSISSYAFYRCSSLTSVTIPNSVTYIDSYAFYGCSSLTSVTIPDSVTSIAYHAFEGCSGLTSITIPDSVTSIGYEAFSGCSGLTSITIPGSVTSIGDDAFYNCSGLTSITIPASVTSIGDWAFAGCSGLTSITYKGTKVQWYEIEKADNFKNKVPLNCKVHCTDGDIYI